MDMKPFNISLCFHGCIDGIDVPSIIEQTKSIRGISAIFGHGHSSSPVDHQIDGFTFSATSQSALKNHHISDVIKYGFQAASTLSSRHLNCTNSMMMAVKNKKDHEISNNIRFDLVILARFGSFDLTQAINKIVGSCRNMDLDGSLYCLINRNKNDNNLWTIDDQLIAASSRDMDTFSRFHFVYKDQTIWSILDSHDIDPAYKTASIGALLYKWSMLRNLGVSELPT